ncbi:MAG: hypothetical protein NTW14_00975 [bacterium]|nr:hypothetical protein [bacterium]
MKGTITITNRGGESVTLVQPGDGSDIGWRTPVVGWSVIPFDQPEPEHPKDPPLDRYGMCGDINPIELTEVFTLKHQESKQLGGWVRYPKFPQPGKFRVVFYYQNIPDLEVSGIPLGRHDAAALELIKRSTTCKLISNEMIITVLPNQQ